MAGDNSNALGNGDSVAAAAIFASFFALLLVAHVVFLAWHRAWFCMPFIIGGAMETTGYIARALGTTHPTSTPLEILRVLCILLAPVLFAAAIYMTLSRIMAYAHGERCSLLRPRWITAVFVGGDVACFFVQAVGAGVVAGGGGAAIGGNIVLGGLGLQIVVFGLFVTVAVVFHVRMKRGEGKDDGKKSMARPAGGRPTMAKNGWEAHIKGLYVMSGFVTGRNVFRVVEYCMGADGYLMQHEWPLYVFDAAMMLVVLSVGLRCYGLKTQKEDPGRLMRESLVGDYDVYRR